MKRLMAACRSPRPARRSRRQSAASPSPAASATPHCATYPPRRYAEASRRAATRGYLARSTADTAEQALRDRVALVAQAEQDIAEQTIALELLTGTLKEAWTQ